MSVCLCVRACVRVIVLTVPIWGRSKRETEGIRQHFYGRIAILFAKCKLQIPVKMARISLGLGNI